MLVSSELAQMMSQYVKCGRTMDLNIVFDKSIVRINIVFDKSIVRKGFTGAEFRFYKISFLNFFLRWCASLS